MILYKITILSKKQKKNTFSINNNRVTVLRLLLILNGTVVKTILLFFNYS